MRFGQDHILAVLRAATEPLTTVRVAEECRLSVGARGGRAAESAEVRSALDKLASEGLVVTATFHEPGNHGYLVPYGQRADRYWATPELAVRIAAAVESRHRQRESADEATARFKRAWAEAGGPPFNTSNAWPYTAVTTESFAGQDVVEIRATHQQLLWLLERLQQ